MVEVDDILGCDKPVAGEKTLRTKFNIRAFHDAVLELGSVPLPVLLAALTPVLPLVSRKKQISLHIHGRARRHELLSGWQVP